MQNTINTLRTSLRQARSSQGLPLYDEREVRAIIDLLLEEVCSLSRTDRVLHPDLQLPTSQRDTLLRLATLLGRGIPVQQALGYEWFCGERFVVSPDVLIPRPETAELVHWIVDEVGQAKSSPAPSDGVSAATAGASPSPVRILDVGTGSGCIALSLARLVHNSQVVALDLSTAALAIARQNASQQGVDNVQFTQGDILAMVDNSAPQSVITGLSTACPQGSEPGCQPRLSTIYPQSDTVYPPVVDISSRCFDIIVSNPPYICQHEAAAMSDLVLQHEPSMALFVPDQDPLLFYRAIARFALTHLASGGHLFFELNAAYGPQTRQLLLDLGYTSVQLRQDVTGRDRMLSALIS